MTAPSTATGSSSVATELIRGGADLVLVADLLGHASVDTLRIYTAPTDADRAHALLTTDD